MLNLKQRPGVPSTEFLCHTADNEFDITRLELSDVIRQYRGAEKQAEFIERTSFNRSIMNLMTRFLTMSHDGNIVEASMLMAPTSCSYFAYYGDAEGELAFIYGEGIPDNYQASGTTYRLSLADSNNLAQSGVKISDVNRFCAIVLFVDGNDSQDEALVALMAESSNRVIIRHPSHPDNSQVVRSAHCAINSAFIGSYYQKNDIYFPY